MPTSVASLLDRVGGSGTAKRFEVEIKAYNTDGYETFTISASNGKPCITATSLSAATAGIGYYLNHYARINISWNQLTADIAHADLPLPSEAETHTCEVPLRYYLNYCTFSYSMAVWTWERWQQEIDWMALHGVNMPLQVVGLDAAWRTLLTRHYGYTEEEVNEFVAGPAFQAWWAMNNLEGWGGPNPAWWYDRQQLLAQRIVQRERELGMSPVLPGFSGMVPSSFERCATTLPQGTWCGFQRPHILDPNSETFATMAAQYYAVMDSLYGAAAFYSIDPFHEGANISGIDVPAAYHSIDQTLQQAHPEARWVIQYWQWQQRQYEVLRQVPHGRLIVLDLFADANPHWSEFEGHDVVYCMLHNFGGRTGFYGRMPQTIERYAEVRDNAPSLCGVGATPEAIETVPAVYDLLYELPWIGATDAASWLREYVHCRYGKADASAIAAWELLLGSALDCRSKLQGPVEAVTCARPRWHIDRVSTWGGTTIFYNDSLVAQAAELLRQANLSGANYSYDLTDLTRQAITDRAYRLMAEIERSANPAAGVDCPKALQDSLKSIILSLNRMLQSQPLFTLDRWLSMAGSIANEAVSDGLLPAESLASAREWLQLNALTLITTWGPRAASERGGLHDYSYRQWAGMLKDFYLPRWQLFFDTPLNLRDSIDWFEYESEVVKRMIRTQP